MTETELLVSEYEIRQVEHLALTYAALFRALRKRDVEALRAMRPTLSMAVQLAGKAPQIARRAVTPFPLPAETDKASWAALLSERGLKADVLDAEDAL